MKKIIATMGILLITGLCFLFSPYVEGSDVGLKVFDKIKQDIVRSLEKNVGMNWKNWEAGIYREYRGKLKELRATVDLIKEDSDENYIYLYTHIIIVGWFTVDDTVKNRLVITRDIMFVVDKRTSIIVHIALISEDIEKLKGWGDVEI